MCFLCLSPAVAEHTVRTQMGAIRCAARRGRDSWRGRVVQVEKQLAELEKLQFSKAQQLFKARAREKDLISEISGGQAQNRNVVTKIQALDDNVIRQQELLYNVEFQLQQMERRVARAKGERSDEEAKVLNERVRALTGQLDGANEQHGMLLGQVRRLCWLHSVVGVAHGRWQATWLGSVGL